ncbi:hypothetical protein [Actinomadura litoris]|uniref:Uncharacterized protein n=1 Tax=Actinomadura litoris TaxID=2678616 RepID=A0A7K1L9I3_9ACTN|nr:hypothetical protein [Actinomadura litoris]MUN41087.1 hypothetical protein [Actinomadura litoris]
MTTLSLTGLGTAASAATPAPADGGQAIAAGGPQRAQRAGVEAPVLAGDVTYFRTRGDNPHITRGEVSVHGWWEKISGKATKAKVTVWLQAHKGAKWKTVATGKRTVGPGSSKRANAREKCKNRTTKVKFRTVVDVDIIGYTDGPEKWYSNGFTLKCKV